MLATKSKENSSSPSEQTSKRGLAKHAEDQAIQQQCNPVWHDMATNTIRAEDGSSSSGSSHTNPSIQEKSLAASNQMVMQRMCAECDQEPQGEVTGIQPKLTIGAPNDPYEQEADAVADKVMRMPVGDKGLGNLQDDSPQIQTKQLNRSLIQRMCTGCEEELGRADSPSVQTKSNGTASKNSVSNSVANTINSPGSGSPLNDSVRSRVEPVLGADLSAVRVHSGAAAQDASQSLNARAFTNRNNIFLGRGQSGTDVQLMAHEATHTVQQGASPTSKNSVQKSNPDCFGNPVRENTQTIQRQVDEYTDWSGRYMGNIEDGDRFTSLELNVNGERLYGRYWVDQGVGRPRSRVETGEVEGYLNGDDTYRLQAVQRYDRINDAGLESLLGTAQFRGGASATRMDVTMDGLGTQSYIRVRAGARTVSNPLGEATGVSSDAPQELTDAMADELTPEEQSRLSRKAEEVALAINDQFGNFDSSFGVAAIAAGPILAIHRRVVLQFDGSRGERFASHFMSELRTHRIRYRGENVRADWALRELIGIARFQGQAGYATDEVHRYRFEFVGQSGDAAAILGAGGSFLTMTVTKLAPNDWSEQSYSYFVGTGRLTATAGASGGTSIARVVKIVETDSDWTPEDFAWSWVRGVEAAGPRGALSAGPLQASGGLFKASMLSLVTDGRQPIQIDLDGELVFFEQNITEDEQTARTEGGVGAEATLGSISGEVGRVVPFPWTEYPDEAHRHQPNMRAENMRVPAQQSRVAFELASDILGEDGAAKLLSYLTAWQPLVADSSVEIHIDGHADLYWHGRGIADDLYPGEAGNIDLSQRRAAAVAMVIQSFVANLPAPADGNPRVASRPVQIRGLGASRHLAEYLQYGALEDLDTRSADIADPSHRSVEVSIAGARPLVLGYSEQ